MNNYFICFLFLVFFLVEYFYIRLAKKIRILDTPNERSSHAHLTVRGGGLIFPFAAIIWCVLLNEYYLFALGIFILSAISFFDDIKPVHFSIRLFFQVLSLVLLYVSVHPSPEHIFTIILFMLCGIYFLNMYNFMDGINGITGAYAIVQSISFLIVFIQADEHIFSQLVLILIPAILAFLFFNFRKKALTFSGDVGSLSLAFIFLFIILSFPMEKWYLYALFSLLYIIDSFFTIIQRILIKEKITQAHRKHLYQYLANEAGYHHLLPSIIYASLQLFINIVFIKTQFQSLIVISICVFASVSYIILKYNVFLNYVRPNFQKSSKKNANQ